MSFSKIETPQELYGNFAYRYQQAQSLPRDKKGVIFMGNTRAGKSTLCCASANVPMSVVYCKGQMTYINPSDPKYSSYVKNINNSVTQRPNFFKSSPQANRVVLVDMPGNDDNVFIRKLINFHYFKTMASNLQQVRFLMVITLQKRKDKYFLDQKQLQMMETFRLMLPKCQENITIILNRVDFAKGKQPQLKVAFRSSITNCTNSDLKNYYGTIGDRQIYVIQRPAYKLGKQGQEQHTQKYDQINKIMMGIVNDESRPFKRLAEEDYNVLNIFNKDNKLNESTIAQFLKLCEGLNTNLTKVRAGFNILAKYIFQRICNQQEIDQYQLQQKVNTLLQEAQKDIKAISSIKDLSKQESAHQVQFKRTIKNVQKDPTCFILSHILKFFNVLTLEQYDRPKNINLKLYQHISTGLLHALMSQLIIIVEHKLPYHGKIQQKLKALYLFLVRRNEQLVFLFKIINFASMKLQEGPFSGIQQSLIDTSIIFTDLKYIDLVPQYTAACNHYMQLDIKQIFVSRSFDCEKDIQHELMLSFDCIIQVNKNLIKDEHERQILEQKIEKKKRLIQLIILLYVEPCPKQKLDLSEKEKDKLKLFIRDLISWDIKNQTETIQFRIHIVYRIADLLHRIKDFKNSLVLHLMLNLNEEAVKLIEVLQHELNSLPCEVYYEMAGYFEKNAQFGYSIKCLEKGKKQTIKNPTYILKFEEKLQKLTNDQFYSKQMRDKLKKKRMSLQTLYQWQQIYIEMQYLRNSYNIKKVNIKALPYMLKNFR